jgi:flagellar basal-body rod modification protein FlgD
MQTTLNNDTGTASSSASSGSGILSNVNGSQLSTMFTQLLVAQIQHQDPTQPTDPSQYVSQLSQLSQVEALQQMTSQSNSTGSVLQSLQTLALGGQVGSTLTVQTNSVTLGSQPVHGNISLANSSSKVALLLTGPDGQQHAVQLGAQGAGEIGFTLDPTQLGLPAGTYALAVQTDSGVSQGAQIAGTLQSVRVGSGGSAVLSISGVGTVDPSAITQYNGRPAA